MSDKHHVIGIGTTGCNIAKLFSVYPQYNIYYFNYSFNLGNIPSYYRLNRYPEPSTYEKCIPNLSSFFKEIEEGDEATVIVNGSSDVAAATLVILEQIKRAKISLVYCRPDLEFLGDVRTKQEFIIFNILQEYARSGVFEKIILVSNPKVEELIGDMSIRSYYSEINERLVYIIHTLNITEHSESVMGSRQEPIPSARLCTIGVMDVETGEEKLLYDLDLPREKCYAYFIKEEDIKSSNSMLKRIKKQMRDKKENNLKLSFGIYSLEFDNSFCFILARSSQIQK